MPSRSQDQDPPRAPRHANAASDRPPSRERTDRTDRARSEDGSGVTPARDERLRAGLILPAQNTIAEQDAHRLLPAQVTVLTTRVPLRSGRPEDLAATGEEAIGAARLLATARPQVIAFHCTAASTVDPDAGDRIAERIATETGIASFATSQALLAALHALDARRIVMLTPYAQAVNDAEVRFFTHHGIEVLREVGLDLTARGLRMDEVPAGEWHERMLGLRDARAQAYFLSCTNIRAMPVVGALEAALQAPVIASNGVTLWHLMRRAGLDARIPGHGRLLEMP